MANRARIGEATGGALLLVALSAVAQPEPRRGRASIDELAAQVEQVASLVKTAESDLRIVETQYSERPEPSDEEAMLRRLSDGEVQYLLGDYQGASVLFYDLVSDKRFRTHPRLADALHYLAESLYQQKNFVGAKLYLRELLGLKSTHHREALARYLEIAGRLNEFVGVDEYIEEYRRLIGGPLPPEIAYVYGKWMFNRQDLSLEERVRRAQEIFAPLAGQDSSGPFRLQAAFFIGVGHVKLKDYPKAIERFGWVAKAYSRDGRDEKTQELANLALGRVHYEVGEYDAAVDRYQEISSDSEYFVDALYEIAWTYVRKGEHTRAFQATELLLDVVGPDSKLAPEAQILQGHLLLKLQRYNDATDTYNEVINRYDPVYMEMEALVKSPGDRDLLPPLAQKWADRRDVEKAVQMLKDLEASRVSAEESDEIARRILRALEERPMESFPTIQEGYTRADAVDSKLTHADLALVRLEGYLVSDALTESERQELERLQREESELRRRFETLPTTESELEARKKRMRLRVDEVDKDAFKLGYDIQSMFAVVAAIEKWVEDTRPKRKTPPEEEKAFLEEIKRQVLALEEHLKELEELRQRLAEERTTADAVLTGEDLIRRRMDDVVARTHQLFSAAEGKVGPDAARVLSRSHAIREQVQRNRERVASAKGKLRDQLARRGQQIREKVLAEQTLLAAYAKDAKDVAVPARSVVAEIDARNNQSVLQKFYDLVLKANVGIVDVAFTRKQDKTAKIQELSAQKDRQLRALDEEFQEVLKDVD